MHMADALLSPAVGGAMWAATGATLVYSARRVRSDLDESKIPLMGVAGAFVFAAQMLNFAIPGTGSSGHLGGALLLAILLGPEAAFIVMASILTVQALFFADGGLLALGANIFNLGFFPAFVAYPLIYRPLVGAGPLASKARVMGGSVLAAVIGLQLGALAVVLETTASGVTAIPFQTFLLFMQPIHLAIGIVEGLVTAAVVLFVQRAQPELLARVSTGRALSGLRLRPVLAAFAIAALLAGGLFSWFASSNDDGLEWSIARSLSPAVTNDALDQEPAAGLQERIALLPDYALKGVQESSGVGGRDAQATERAGTSLSGVVGAAITLAAIVSAALVLKRRSARARRARG